MNFFEAQTPLWQATIGLFACYVFGCWVGYGVGKKNKTKN